MATKHHAWNPGLEQDIPYEYSQLETIHNPSNVSTNLKELLEVSKATKIKPEELICFRAERLFIHEILIRLTADVVIIETKNEEEFGIKFRQLAHKAYTSLSESCLPDAIDEYKTKKQQARLIINQIIEQEIQAKKQTPLPKKKLLFFRKRPCTINKETEHERRYRTLQRLKTKGHTVQTHLEKECYKSLYQTLNLLYSRSETIYLNESMLLKIATIRVCNSYCSQKIGEIISPYFDSFIQKHNLHRVPVSEYPVLLSLKGASAAGKSSFRPSLKAVFQSLGVQEDQYGTISPDIWRRFLLDYSTLGQGYKYAGRLTSREISIIDEKLDKFIRDRSIKSKSIPNLLVDRFRFDSFSSERVSNILHDTYAQYVSELHMYFIITPPEETVVRGWHRGLERGRYKSVEEFLDHSVEAYSGIPKLLRKWLSYSKPKFKFYFLDNSVPKGTKPRVFASGDQKKAIIYSLSGLIDIDRFRKINTNAKSAKDVYKTKKSLKPEDNTGLFNLIISTIPSINFKNQNNKIYLILENGRTVYSDRSEFMDLAEASYERILLEKYIQ